MSKCYKTSNNKFLNAPARMSYGFLTDYSSNFKSTDSLYTLSDEKLKSSYLQRQYLINNAVSLINVKRQHEFLKNGHGDCKNPDPPGTMLPEQEKQVCNIHSCNITHNFEKGIGQGRDFGNIDESCLDYYYGKPLTFNSKDGNDCKDNYNL